MQWLLPVQHPSCAKQVGLTKTEKTPSLQDAVFGEASTGRQSQQALSRANGLLPVQHPSCANKWGLTKTEKTPSLQDAVFGEASTGRQYQQALSRAMVAACPASFLCEQVGLTKTEKDSKSARCSVW